MRAAPPALPALNRPLARGEDLFYFIGYLGSSLFGLGAAKLIQAGYIVAAVSDVLSCSACY